MPIDLGPIQFDEAVVLRQLRQDLKDDWFPDPRRFEDVFGSSWIQDITSENFTKNQGAYVPSPRQILNVPKANFTLRYALETSITDRALYHALTSFVVPFYDPLLPWSVFSHRYGDAKDHSKSLFRRAIPAWQDFIGVVRNALNTKPVLLSTDLTNYFDNIDIGILKSTMMVLLPELGATAAEKGHIRSHIEALFECLKKWCYSESVGLPQNRDASSFLANIYMLPVDRAMLDAGYDYFRYMDDIKIVCKDEFEARLALKRLSLELRKIRLSVNSGKTQISSRENGAEIDRSLDAGGRELQQIDSIWQTRSIGPISRSFPLLRDFTQRLLIDGKVASREFRYCIRRLETLAHCPEFAVPDAYFSTITPLVIDAIPLHPAVTDQLVKYLRAVPTTDADLAKISDHLRNSDKSFYTWQNYRLWLLLVQKSYQDPQLLAHAVDVVKTMEDNATRSGATLYAGALGGKAEREAIARNFGKLNSFLGQRAAIVAVQQLHYAPLIRDNVQPYLRDDLKGMYRGLDRKGVYVAPPEITSITQVVDTERDYD